MGLPLLMYHVAPLVNPSFETDTPSDLVVPTGWDTTFNQTDEQAGTSAGGVFSNRGSGHGAQALRLELPMGYLSNDVVGQTLPTSWLPSQGSKIAILLKVQTLLSIRFKVWLREMDDAVVRGSTSFQVAAGSGAITVYLEKTLAGGATVDRIRVEFTDFVNEDPFNEDQVWIDYLHIGRPVNFTEQPFASLDVAQKFRSVVNQGGSAFEAVELADPFATLRADFMSIAVGSQLEADLMAFYGYSRRHRRFVFWKDRDDSTNQGKHFSECFLTRGLDERHGRGAALFGSRFEAMIPREWVDQEVA